MAQTESTTKPKAKSGAKKQQELRRKIISHYQEYVLLYGENPASVFAFCKELEIDEADFYRHFSSFEQIAGTFWRDQFNENLSRLQDSPEFDQFTVREKLLSFYYSFFESLKSNRSYALQTLEGENFKTDRPELEGLKKDFKLWIKSLIAEGRSKEEIASRSPMSDQYDRLFWYHFYFLLDFWRKDRSTNFERSDEAIEKSVNLAFDLIEKNALDTAFDFGKFLFQNIR